MRNVLIIAVLLSTLFSVILNDLGIVHAVSPWLACCMAVVAAVVAAVAAEVFIKDSPWIMTTVGGLIFGGLVLGSEKFDPEPRTLISMVALGFGAAGFAHMITKRDE